MRMSWDYIIKESLEAIYTYPSVETFCVLHKHTLLSWKGCEDTSQLPKRGVWGNEVPP
jgi:hypothetical protein